MASYDALAQPTLNSFNEIDATDAAGCIQNWGIVRAESMDVCNDPRFFAKNVMDKRLGAFKSLTIVSSLMFGTAMGQCFKLKKDQDFSDFNKFVGYIAIWQTVGFVISIIVACMCLLSLYVIAHQLFYTIRLMTSGPTGFEQASVFYLTRVIVMWRHMAIKCLFNGLWIFMFQIGVQLFVKFYKDADSKKSHEHAVWVANVVGGNSTSAEFVHLPSHHKLDMFVHSFLAYGILAMFLSFAILLIIVRKQHLTVFQSNYKSVKTMTNPIETTMRNMSYRSGSLLET